MKQFSYKYIAILFLIIAISLTGCKKKIFSPLTFSGKIVNEMSLRPMENCAVVLYKKKGSVLARNGVTDDEKEICRATTDANGEFSMDLKWLDNRDRYYVLVNLNNSPLQISSGNSSFSGYKALDSYVEFKVR